MDTWATRPSTCRFKAVASTFPAPWAGPGVPMKAVKWLLMQHRPLVIRPHLAEVFRAPQHPYTQRLLSAVPVPDPKSRDREKLLLEGEIPSPMNLPSGCRFRTRCPYAAPLCAEVDPPSVFEGSRSWACHRPL